MSKTIAEAQTAATRDAAWILNQFWDDVYPVDPFKISRDLGISVFLGDLPENISGMLKSDADGLVTMYIDTDDSDKRQRFTGAHELGHFVERFRDGDIGGGQPPIAFVDRRGELSKTGVNAREIYANQFAASLLMPEIVVRRLRKQDFDGWELARFFNVSLTAMEYRLRNLQA